MFSNSCNIDNTDRINRSVFGIIIIIGALLGFSTTFFVLLGGIMLAEGIIGWCGIPKIVALLKKRK